MHALARFERSHLSVLRSAQVVALALNASKQARPGSAASPALPGCKFNSVDALCVAYDLPPNVHAKYW